MYITGRTLVWGRVILIFLFPDICGFILVLAQKNTPMSSWRLCYYIATTGLLDQDQIAQQSAELMPKWNDNQIPFCFQSQRSKFYFG